MKGKRTSFEKIEEVKVLSRVYRPSEVSRRTGVPLRTVHSILAKKDPPKIEAKREEKRLEIVGKVWDDKAEEIARLKLKTDMILDALTQEKVNNARLTELSTAYGTLFDKIRLLNNESTQNLSVRGMMASLEAMKQDLQQRADQLTRELEDDDR
jgi:hypothetical protein